MTKKILLFLVVVFVGIPALLWIQRRTNPNSPLSMTAPQGTYDMKSGVMMAEPTMGRAGVTIEDSAMELMPVPPTTGEGFTPDVDRTIVKNASLAILVKDTRQTVTQITEMVKDQAGFVTAANIYENQYEKGVIHANMTLRVPVDQLENTMAKIRGLADKVTADTLTADDRTEQKIDMEAQLKNLRATEEQLLSIMRQATTVEDTLQVQKELNNVRSQIERLQARLDNLTGDAAMSTLTVSISTKESDLPIVDPGKRTFLEEIKLAVKDAVSLYRELLVASIRLVILAGPVLLIAGIGYWFYKRKK